MREASSVHLEVRSDELPDLVRSNAILRVEIRREQPRRRRELGFQAQGTSSSE